jgi:UDP-glucose 4-epimerase
MSVLVTGGRGYVGRYVVDALAARGERVVDYSRDLGPGPRHELHVPVLGELGDIPRLLTVLRDYCVERIIHTAAQSHPDVSLEMPLATVESNVMGTTCVLEAARLSGVRRVVVYSSECAYGHTPGAAEPGSAADGSTVQGPAAAAAAGLPPSVPESTPLHPRTPYGVTKAACEMLAAAYNESFGLDVVALRVAQVYGPGQVMPETVRDVVLAAVRGETFRLAHGRDQKLQLVHVTDVMRATLDACFADGHGKHVYNITGGVQPTLGEVLDLVAELVPGFAHEVGPGEIGGDRQGLFEIDAARRDLGYEPQVDLRDGLRGYVDWLREHEF